MNQVGGALGGLNAGNPRGRDDVALRQDHRGPERHRLRLHPDDALGHGVAGGDVLAADVDHAGAARLVDVAQAGDGTVAAWTAAIRSRTACSSPWRRSSIGSGSPLTIVSKKSLRSW